MSTGDVLFVGGEDTVGVAVWVKKNGSATFLFCNWLTLVRLNLNYKINSRKVECLFLGNFNQTIKLLLYVFWKKLLKPKTFNEVFPKKLHIGIQSCNVGWT